MATSLQHDPTLERVSPDIADDKDSLPALEETTSDMSARPKPTTNVLGTGQGWTELKEDGGRVRHLLLHDSKNGSAQDVELQETETMRTGSGAADPGADQNASTAGTPGAVEYRVYKRRWFGLVQLALLNIIVSWDVSHDDSLPLPSTCNDFLRPAARVRNRASPNPCGHWLRAQLGNFLLGNQLEKARECGLNGFARPQSRRVMFFSCLFFLFDRTLEIASCCCRAAGE